MFFKSGPVRLWLFAVRTQDGIATGCHHKQYFPTTSLFYLLCRIHGGLVILSEFDFSVQQRLSSNEV
jgi:hypothetical protein